MGAHYQRVLLKLSGEALMGNAGYGIDPAFLAEVAQELAEVHGQGVELGLVVGGGNIFRGLGASAREMDRTSADHMGMLATVINAIALRDALERQGVPAVVMSALAMPVVAETYTRRAAVAYLESGRVVVFAAGTGNPFFTTDTAAALRAVEIGADLLVKGTKVDGVYSADPVQDPHAERYESLKYSDVLDKQLKVMDLTAVTLCRENGLSILVCSMLQRGTLGAVFRGEERGTLIEEG